MADLKGSKTEQNLAAAFAGESQARNKYTYFAKVAKKEGYHYIAKAFEESANNEMRHAKDHFLLLDGISDTEANLQAALDGEVYEHVDMYPTFAKEAKEEGFDKAAILFEMIARVEKKHAERYERLLGMVKAGTVYKRETAIGWKCSVCGYIHEGIEPPAKCPACQHPREYYEPIEVA